MIMNNCVQVGFYSILFFGACFLHRKFIFSVGSTF